MLASLQDIVTAVDKLSAEWQSEIWWRGHASNTFRLQPGIYRADRGTRAEQNLALRFRQHAPTRHANCPAQDDFVSWLFLMQHYGMPTRLLDWTSSALVATFFAVIERPEEDSVLWALDPRKLNVLVRGDATLVPTSTPPAPDLITAAFNDKVRENCTIAVLTHEIDDRMLVQQAAFTIHGTEEPLDARADASEFLRDFEIPASAKQQVRSQLSAVGYRRSTLFPDLENLALDLKNLVFPS